MKNVHSPRLTETGSFSLISCQTSLFWKKLLPRSKRANWPSILPEALQRRLVEAVQRLDLLDLLRIDTLSAAIGADVAPAGSAPGLGDVLLHRPARHELRHDEGQDQHAEQRGQHQQDAFGDVGGHAAGYLAVIGGMRAHQTVIGQSMYETPSGGYGGTTAGRSSFQAS